MQSAPPHDFRIFANPLWLSARRSRAVLTLSLSLILLLNLILAGSALAQRDLKDIPDPDPELERRSFIVADGLEVNLFAADPLLAKPIQMNFDAQGRLWIASSEVYPHILPGQAASDKILVLEDTDGDGKSDRSTVFADGLLIPTGVVPGDGGAYVANSTELIHLRDTDGDGKSDQRRVVLSGFGTEDTHHLLHTLRWGPDGALYMNQSIYIHSHVETPYGVKRLNGGGIWRFRPDTLQLDILCRGFVNPWGHHFDQWGQSFATDGAYGEGINYVFPGAVYVTAPGATRRVLGLNPGSPKHCGLEIVSGRHFPDDWRGNMITNDFRAHRVCRFVVTEDAAGYASRQETELIKSTHVAFRPIDVKMGPDGAIYVADWYNPIIQHGEVDFRDPRRDHTHGRIWRITYKGRPTLATPNFAEASIPELLDLLKQPEQWNRLHAKLTLKQRDASEVLTALHAWLAALDPNDPASVHHRLEGLWVLECLNQVNESLLAELLASPDHRVRAAGLRVVGRRHGELADTRAYLRQGVVDPHPRVRLEAVRALAELDAAESAEWALYVLDQPMDDFLDFALWQTMRDLAPKWLPALRAGQPVLGDNEGHLTYALRAVDSPEVIPPLLELVRGNKVAAERLPGVVSVIASLGNADELGEMLRLVLRDGSPLAANQKAALLDGMVQSSRQRKIVPRAKLDDLQVLFDAEALDLRAAAVRAAGAWKLESVRPRLMEWAGHPETTPPPLLAASIESLAMLGGPASQDALNQLAQPPLPLLVRTLAIQSLAEVDVPRAAELTIKLLVGLEAGQDPADAIAAVLQRKEGPSSLLKALGGQRLEPDKAQLAVRAVQRSSQPSPELLAALRAAGSLNERRWKLTPELRDELVGLVAERGDPARGEAVYRRKELQCTKCHAIGGAGGSVGPDLVSIGASAQVDYLVDSLLDPGSKIKENYHALIVQDEDGKVHTGIVVRKSDRELVLRDAEDRLVTIPVDSIVGQREGRSLMPDGSVDTLTQPELVDLVRFLSELGKVGQYAIGQQRLVRSWQTLVPTDAALNRIRRTSFDTAASDDPALQWESAYSQLSGQLPLADLPELVAPTYVTQQRDNRTTFVRFYLDVTTAGPVRLALGSGDDLLLWLDGKPTPLADPLDLNLTTGRHCLTLSVDRLRRQEPLRVELLDVPGSPAQVQIATQSQNGARAQNAGGK